MLVKEARALVKVRPLRCPIACLLPVLSPPAAALPAIDALAWPLGPFVLCARSLPRVLRPRWWLRSGRRRLRGSGAFTGFSLSFVDLSLSFTGLSLPFVELSLPFLGLSLPFVELSLPFTDLPLSFNKNRQCQHPLRLQLQVKACGNTRGKGTVLAHEVSHGRLGLCSRPLWRCQLRVVS